MPSGLKLPELPEPLDSRIRQLAQIRSQLAADELQIVDLSDVIAEFGNRWENVRSRVLTTALHFLKKRLADYDTLIPCSDGFIIIFGTRKGPEAATAGRRLAEALSKFFLGDQALGKCSAPCKYLTLGLNEIETFMRTLNSTAAPGADESHKHTWDYRIRFRPVREVRRNFIVSYFTEPIDLHGRPLEQEEATTQNFATRRAKAELEHAAIVAGTAALRKVISSGGRILIGFTVHIETLDDHAHCHLILDALAQIEPELRRYAAIRITHVPPGFPRFHLDEHIHLLHQQDIRLALDMSLDDHNTDILAHPFISSFGLHFDQRTAALFRDPSSHALAQLRTRVHRIHEARKRIALIADGCAGPLALAHEIEADYVSALNVWPFCEEPTSLHMAHEHQV